ncbi:MAG: CAP domain-containing protein [Actinomycetota bacterium]
MHVLSDGRRKLGAVLALLLSALLMAGVGPLTADANAEERYGRRRQMLGLTNEDRTARDRRELNFAAALSKYAKSHSEAMAREGYLFHSSQDQLRAVLNGYDWSIAGENVGVGGSLESLEDAFMESRLHRENILRREFARAAVGIVREEGRLWVTVIFYG